MYDPGAILTAARNLRVYEQRGRRAPHKPLLLLVVLGQLIRGRRHLDFDEVEASLLPMLDSYAPPKKGRHEPAYPYWHLQSDGLWEVDWRGELRRQRSGFPTKASLRRSRAGLPAPMADALLADRTLIQRLVRLLLDDHFPFSLHAEILDIAGLDIAWADEAPLAADAAPAMVRRVRDPEFRRAVLRAYEHRCAATGFRTALGQSYFGVEAAHVRWHSHGGPDTPDNGLVLEPTMHKLFDRGAWSLTDDRHVLVSAELTGSDEAMTRLRSLHGRPLRAPLPGHPPVAPEFIRWHREAGSGGVFRSPALGAVCR